MSIAKPVLVAPAKNGAHKLFAKIKNGNIYLLNTPVAPSRAEAMAARILDAGKIHLKHWTKVERGPRIAPSESLTKQGVA